MSGAAWMVERELSVEGPSGGILADAMVSGRVMVPLDY